MNVWRWWYEHPLHDCDNVSSQCIYDVVVTDINECTEVGDFDQPLHDCDVLATCDNTLGGYTCTCFPGFEGDGQTCEGKKQQNTVISKHGVTLSNIYIFATHDDKTVSICLSP